MESKKEIHDRMLRNISDKYDKTRGSFFYDGTKPAAIEFEKKNQEIKAVQDKLDIENLSGEELEMWIGQRTPITRKPATKSSGLVVISGQEGSSISKSDLVASDTINFLSLENKRMDGSGQVNVLVECEEYGAIGNVPAETINRFPITIPGLINVYNPEPFTNGYEAETDDELRQRYYERIRTPITSGNKYHYLNWAKEVVGVGDAKVISLWAGDNTVKVIIIDSNKQPAGGELIEEVQEYIDPGSRGLGEGQAPIGAFCTVVSANSKDISVSVTVTKDDNYSMEQIEINIKDGITEYLRQVAFKKNLISYAQIGFLILEADGVLDYTNLRVNGDMENIIVENEEVAILGEVVLSE